MVSPELFIKTLYSNGINFFAGVPDSLLKNVCACITDTVPEERNIISANEGCAIGVAAGHYLATGETPLIYMQNSGLGNAVNPLLSLADDKVYSIPMILMIGWRGEPGVHDEPQHIKQGEVTLALLEAMQIPYDILPLDEESAISTIRKAVLRCRQLEKPYAVIIRKGTFDSYALQKKSEDYFPLSREEALKQLIDLIPYRSILVSTTGKLSRELFEYRDEMKKSHESDFLTVGSMGHSSSIALGIALAKPNRRVFCLDGDGAFIMHMGSISSIGHLAPDNYVHVVFNNGAHESVGGQPTVGLEIDIPRIAKDCGYKKAMSVTSLQEINSAMENVLSSGGPSMIEIRVRIDSRENLGRPSAAPIENKHEFMNFIKEL